MHFSKFVSAAIAFLSALIFPAASQAQAGSPPASGIYLLSSDTRSGAPPWRQSRFRLTAGGFQSRVDTKIRLGGPGDAEGDGTLIDLENLLGLERHLFVSQTRLEWRASTRDLLILDLYKLRRQRLWNLSQTIEFGEDTFTLNARVSAYFNTDIVRFAYGRAFYSDARAEAGLLIGAHVVDAGMGIAGELQDFELRKEENFGVTAPLPDIGLFAAYSPVRNWALRGSVNYLSLKFGNLSGQIYGGSTALEYVPHRRVVLGVEYQWYDTILRMRDDQRWLRLDWAFQGPYFYAGINL